MPQYKLHYFNGKARAESTRYLFALAGVKFEDRRFEMDEWPGLKSSFVAFQVPVLEIDGKQFGQSKAILGYLGRKYDLFGKTETDSLTADEVIHIADDVVPPWDLILFAENDEEKAKETKKFKEDVMPAIYKSLARVLEQDQSGKFFIGDEVTAADLHFVSMVELVEIYLPNSLASFPKLKAVYDRVVAIPAISKYRKERPVTPW